MYLGTSMGSTSYQSNKFRGWSGSRRLHGPRIACAAGWEASGDGRCSYQQL